MSSAQLREATIRYERLMLELRRNEIAPTQTGAALPPLPSAIEFASWLKAARLWRDLHRRARNK